MKKIFLLSLIALVVISCSEKKSDDQSGIVTDTTLITVDRYQQMLSQLPPTDSSSMSGLNLFDAKVSKTDSLSNDRALKIYMDFQTGLLDSLNKSLVKRNDYEAINTLQNIDLKERKIDGIAYEKRLNTNGLKVRFSEGMAYIDANPIAIRDHFYQHLSSSGKAFLKQYEKEANQPYAEDNGLVIEPNELADRLAFWDVYQTKNSSSIFSEEARKRKETYLFFLLLGLNNTPAFEYETEKLDPKFKEAYAYYAKQYPQSASAAVIEEYLNLLNKSGYKKDENVERFINGHSIY